MRTHKNNKIDALSEVKLTRREFTGFFVLGGFLSAFLKSPLSGKQVQEKKAMFWRRTDET